MVAARHFDGSYRLAAEVFTPIIPNHGMYESRVLGLEVQVERDRLRFYAGTALLLESEELIARLQAMADDAQQRAAEEAVAAAGAVLSTLLRELRAPGHAMSWARPDVLRPC